MAPASIFRSRIAAAAAALGLLLGTACSGKKSSSNTSTANLGSIAGTLTYVRVPLAKDSNGVPTGLDTLPADAKVLPARGVVVRAYEYDTTNTRWIMRQSGITDSNGQFTLAVPAGDNYTVQVESYTQPFSATQVTLLADPNGLSSTLSEFQRPRYLLRSAPNGTPATNAQLQPVSSVASGQTYTVNFAVTLATAWMTGDTELNREPNNDLTSPQFASAAFESSPTGSRVLAILDDVYAFSVLYGDPTPGASLDLHYLMGRSESGGTYIEYNRSKWVQPSGIDLAYDSATMTDRYFGSIRGASANDDAWDEAVLFQLFSRAYIYNQEASFAYGTYPYRVAPVGSPTVDNLSSDMALQEALPLIMAANYLQSPYLADTDGTSGLVSVTDIRDLSGVAPANQGPYSPHTLAAALWEINLKAAGITSPGTVTNWATLNPKSILRLFTLPPPPIDNMPSNIYLQLGKLKDAKIATEPTDLAAIFNDTTINTITSPFNLPWPQPTTTVFGQSWTSTTSGTYVYSSTLSMAKDTVQVNGAYPNASYQELVYLVIPQTTDQTYNMTLATTPSTLPAGATIQVTFFTGTTTQAYTYSGSSASPIVRTLQGNGSTTTPVQYPVMVRLLSPTTSQPDIPFTLTLTPAANGTLRGTGSIH